MKKFKTQTNFPSKFYYIYNLHRMGKFFFSRKVLDFSKNESFSSKIGRFSEGLDFLCGPPRCNRPTPPLFTTDLHPLL